MKLQKVSYLAVCNLCSLANIIRVAGGVDMDRACSSGAYGERRITYQVLVR
jgi:hypothetical protein